MQAFRFIHAADLHLDSPFRGMTNVPKAIRDRVKGAALCALQRLVDLAIEKKAQFVLIAGDVYDLADRSLRAQLRFQKEAERLAETGIQMFIVHGNHDPLDGRRASLKVPRGVHVFRADDVQMIPAYAADGTVLAHVYGISYPTASVTEPYAKRFRAQRSDVYNIGLLHTNVDGDPNHDNYAPASRADLLQAGMDYWALGHIHTRTVLNRDPWIVYCGNLQGRSVRETGPKGCYIVDVSESGSTVVDFCALDALRWFQESINVEEVSTVQELHELLGNKIEQVRVLADGRPSIVRFILEGRSVLHANFFRSYEGGVDELLEELRRGELRLAEQDANSEFVWIESIRLRTSPLIEREPLLEQVGYLGDLLRFAEELKQQPDVRMSFIKEQLAAILAQPKAARHVQFNGKDELDMLAAAEQLAIDLLADSLDSAHWQGLNTPKGIGDED